MLLLYTQTFFIHTLDSVLRMVKYANWLWQQRFTRYRLLDVVPREAPHSRLETDSPQASGGRSPGSNPLCGGYVYCIAPEVPLFRGMPTRPEAFLELPAVSEQRPCARTHVKKGLGPYSAVSWGVCQIAKICKVVTASSGYLLHAAVKYCILLI